MKAVVQAVHGAVQSLHKHIREPKVRLSEEVFTAHMGDETPSDIALKLAPQGNRSTGPVRRFLTASLSKLILMSELERHIDTPPQILPTLKASIAPLPGYGKPKLAKRSCSNHFDERDVRKDGNVIRIRYLNDPQTGLVYPRKIETD